MRKIRLSVALDTKTYDPVSTVVVRDENNEKTVFKKTFLQDPLLNYTPQQREMIRMVNSVLTENNQSTMSVEEMNWFVDPDGWTKKDDSTTEAELQALAGFRVEKKVVPFPIKETV